MKTYLHGTSYESAMNILQNGFTKNKDTIWSCSNKEMIYVREMQDDDSDAEYLCIESGQIAAAYTNSIETKICLVRFEIPDDIAEEYVADDNSCENTEGCYQIYIEDLNKLVDIGTIKVYIDVYEDSYVPYLRPFYLAYVSDSYMLIKDPLLKQAIKVINDTTSYIFEDLMCHGDIIETREYAALNVA